MTDIKIDIVFIGETNWRRCADSKVRQTLWALLGGGLWQSCCLRQETCEPSMGSVEDLAATHKHTHTYNAGKFEALPGHTGLGSYRQRVTRNEIRCCCAESPEQGEGLSQRICKKIGSISSVIYQFEAENSCKKRKIPQAPLTQQIIQSLRFVQYSFLACTLEQRSEKGEGV